MVGTKLRCQNWWTFQCQPLSSRCSYFAHEKSLSPASWLTMTMMMMMKMKRKRRGNNHPAPNFPTPALPVEAQAVSIPEHQLLVIAARHQGWSTRMEGKALDLAPSPSAHHTWPAMPAMPAIRHFKSLQTSTNIYKHPKGFNMSNMTFLQERWTHFMTFHDFRLP